MGLKSTANFEELLKEYQPHKLIEDRQKKTNYFWSKLKKDSNWKDGASYQIPWELSEASAFEIGGLIESGKITDAIYKKGTISEHAFMSGAMKYHSRDLKRYGDLKQSFLKLLPNKARKFSDRMTYLTNIMLLDKGSLAVAPAVSVNHDLASGVVAISKPQRFMKGERFMVVDGTNADVEAYVGKIDINKKTIECVDASGAAIDLAALGFDPAVESISFKLVGYDRDQFFTMVDHLLPAEHGGSDTVNGIVNKSEAPIFQPQVISGSAWTKATILEDIYDFYFSVKELSKVEGVEVLCGYDVFKACVIASEGQKRYTTTKKAGIGYQSVCFDGPFGEMVLTTLEQMPNDKMFVIDWDSFVFAGDEFFKPMKDMNGNLYYTERIAGTGNGNDGHVSIQDIALSGQLINIRPSGNAAVHSIAL